MAPGCARSDSSFASRRAAESERRLLLASIADSAACSRRRPSSRDRVLWSAEEEIFRSGPGKLVESPQRGERVGHGRCGDPVLKSRREERAALQAQGERDAPKDADAPAQPPRVAARSPRGAHVESRDSDPGRSSRSRDRPDNSMSERRVFRQLEKLPDPASGELHERAASIPQMPFRGSGRESDFLVNRGAICLAAEPEERVCESGAIGKSRGFPMINDVHDLDPVPAIRN